VCVNVRRVVGWLGGQVWTAARRDGCVYFGAEVIRRVFGEDAGREAWGGHKLPAQVPIWCLQRLKRLFTHVR
jgi:hypothetical protein